MHRATESGSTPFVRLNAAAGARSASESSLQSLDVPSRDRAARFPQHSWTLGGWASLRSRAPSPASTWAFCVGAALGMVLMSTFFLGATLHRDRGSRASVVATTPLVRGTSALQAEHAASAAEAMLRAAAALAAGLDRGGASVNGSSVADDATAVDFDDDGRGFGDDEAEDDYAAEQQIDGAPAPASHTRAAWVALRAAALAASARGPPVGVSPRVAFLFLTRGPLPHAPLWERFFLGHENEYVIHVHAAPGFELNASTVASPVFYGRTVASPVVVEWGQMSVVAAERRLFASALLDSSVARLVLLSESCVPLRNFSYVKDYLLSSEKSFLDSFIDVQSRYNPRMAPTIPEAEWRKGTQWAAVTRAHAELFIADDVVFLAMRRHCRTWTAPDGRYGSFCAGDEHYLQVLIQLRGREHEIERRGITFANWFPTTRSHPKLYVVQEVTAELVQDLQSRTELWRPMEGEHMHCGRVKDTRTGFELPRPCWLFARKFSERAGQRLLVEHAALLGI